MAEDKRWWKRAKDSDTSKEDVEDLLNEAEAKRLQREEELAEAEHQEKMAEFTDPVPSTMKESESGDGSPVEYIGQRLVLKPDDNNCFYVDGSIGNISNLRFLVDTGASFCSVPEKIGVIDTVKTFNLKRGEVVETTTAAGPGMGYRTTLPNITIGQMTINNVDALINPLRTGDSEYCILGMSFLEHIDWKHENGMLILNPDGESDGTKVYGSGSGSGSNHWLLEDPGYTIAAVVLAFGLIATAFMGVMGAGAADEWASTDAEVVDGTEWWEWEYEVEDDWGDYWYEYECGADVNYAYSVGEVDYTGEDGINLGTWDDYCLDIVEFEELPLGSNVTIYYEINNPGNSRIDSPGASAIFFFFCSLIQLLLLAAVLVLARLDVAGPSVNFSSGGRYYDDPGYYDRPWHRRPWFHRRRHHHHHHRHHSRSRRKVGGRSSSGGSRRSSGGSRRSSGGSRRSSGGRRR
jgi:aspartyl protease family protein